MTAPIPYPAPGFGEPGRLVSVGQLVAGQHCRWCSRRLLPLVAIDLESPLTAKPSHVVALLCPTCDRQGQRR